MYKWFNNKGVNIDIGKRCGLMCGECQRQTYPGTKKLGKDISTEDFRKVLNHFESINFCGQLSDPIHHPKFIDFLRMAHEHEDRKLVSVHVASSFKPREWFIKAFEANPNASWWFGIDGWPEDSSKYRINQDGQKLYEVMLDAKRILNRTPKWQCIRFNYNEHYLEELKQHAYEIGVQLVILHTDRWSAVPWLRPSPLIKK